ncbi:hypothetical protein ElyMa_006412600 [Elysia marginata]|uniref:Uncharacterized protein n=1 Tax=Elysia marginata TaxID=1093978 RepID=A0AAV4HTT2_9GAST|nr:hypothetical protein ElyMa_006412600 [Elysia marginata]
MLVKKENRRACVLGQTPRMLFIVGVLMLLAARLPSTTAKRFTIKDKDGKSSVLIDINFSINLIAKKDGEVVATKKLNSNQIQNARLGGMWTGFKSVLFEFYSFRNTGFLLSYTFDLDGSPGNVSMTRSLYMTPKKTLLRAYSPLKNIKFEVPDRLNLGEGTTSFLCDKTETVFFKKVSQRSDGYEYSVEMETTSFRVQAFSVKSSYFSRSTPYECKDPSSSGSNSKRTAIIVGSVVGGVVLVAVVVAAVVAIVYFRRKRSSGISKSDGSDNL